MNKSPRNPRTVDYLQLRYSLNCIDNMQKSNLNDLMITKCRSLNKMGDVKDCEFGEHLSLVMDTAIPSQASAKAVEGVETKNSNLSRNIWRNSLERNLLDLSKNDIVHSVLNITKVTVLKPFDITVTAAKPKTLAA